VSLIDEIRRRIRREMERLEREMEEMFSEAERIFGHEEPMWDASGRLEPLYSVYEAPDAYIFRFDLAGADLGTLQVEARGRRLLISCKLQSSVRFEKWGTVQRRVSFQEYRKEILLPPDADPSGMRVRTRDKIVEVIVPRK
jgi:HSP20 family protein